MTDQELVKRPFDEEFDTMMEVQRNPTGAWMAIQEQANRIDELEKRCSLYARTDRLFVEEINDLNAKLTKAMEALRETTQMLSQCTFTIIRMGGRYFERHEVVDKANAVLVELENK